ncbi:nicotinate-nucleotide diphosphorylase (carboxylating) [Saccharobesus litoralis]|uniref:Probable nicotinate-nucleotide pyrophosphorylase [carboxylating] n=1 Tax=Saccharobesus litoralis TaxID=2172099 RepID=A0A2S0VX18_9ALTE|nr:carboxylating nicotinate-nucleotide diphosphorylase [Saccharobesus litoralis]AWB68712.1 nicotinate-nucleotide diphosphorylase (carboxylating) [Saccharobesus litoralis]
MDLQQTIQAQVTAALIEDLSAMDPKLDITAQLIPANNTATAKLITREDCIVCGVAWVNETFKQLGAKVEVEWQVKDGDKVKANSTLCYFKGNAQHILTGERTAMNFLQTLSATATLTATYAEKIAHTSTKLLDTRKTIPGLRLAQKYAVKCGGGENHRIGLFDAFLIKENHIAAAGSIANAVKQAHNIAPGKPVEVEVENNDELQQALTAGADIVMLDNYTPEQIAAAVAIANGQIKIEVSGDITLDTIASYAQTGVDYISSGALTKHVQAVDLSLRLSL